MEKERARTSSDNRGFTLFELMVVLLLLGSIFLLTFPNFRQILEPRDIKRAVLQFVGSLKYAQSQAATTKQTHRLYVDLKDNSFWVSKEGDRDSFSRDASTLGTPQSLPPGVIFLDVIQPERGKVREGKGYVNFSPTGWADECTIHLRRGEEEIYTIFIHPLGGKVEIASGYLEKRVL